MNAYMDTYIEEIEKGTCNGLVTPGMLSQLFKLFMISPYSAPVETMNAFLAGLGEKFHMLDRDSLCNVSQGLAARGLTQTDVFTSLVD
jgi:hypothetical protein